MLKVGQVIDTMRAGLLRMGQWIVGAVLTALVALAHAQPGFHGGGGGGFERAPVVREAPRGYGGMQGMRGMSGMPGMRYAPHGGAASIRVADQGGWRERGGGRQAGRRDNGGERGYGGNPYSNPYGNGFATGGGYHGPIQPVSAETRQVPHPPADSPVRAGSIREDVARYNEERGGGFRPYTRGGGDVPRPPMSSPYRN
ncbi:hypothetical protein [Paraburkholderia sp.]|uniref:hypothetical protein n=1 Tax=Paraburkholderia sp. TaxID=1926495 RepID=UPI00286F2C0C|nr:hypothetical protein [Paraburkholderia sp.]